MRMDIDDPSGKRCKFYNIFNTSKKHFFNQLRVKIIVHHQHLVRNIVKTNNYVCKHHHNSPVELVMMMVVCTAQTISTTCT